MYEGDRKLSLPIHRFRVGRGPRVDRIPSGSIKEQQSSFLLRFFVAARMSPSSPASPTENWPLRTSSLLSHRSISSSIFSFSRYDELLAKFPLPPQGRTPSYQIGLFPAIYTSPYIPSSTPNTAETRPLSVSQESPADIEKRSLSSRDYEGLGIHS